MSWNLARGFLLISCIVMPSFTFLDYTVCWQKITKSQSLAGLEKVFTFSYNILLFISQLKNFITLVNFFDIHFPINMNEIDPSNKRLERLFEWMNKVEKRANVCPIADCVCVPECEYEDIYAWAETHCSMSRLIFGKRSPPLRTLTPNLGLSSWITWRRDVC